MSKSQNDTHWAGFPVTVKSLKNSLDGGGKNIFKGYTLQLKLLYGRATELLNNGKSAPCFPLTEYQIHIIIFIACSVSSNLISRLFSLCLWAAVTKLAVSSGDTNLPPRAYDFYNQSMVKKTLMNFACSKCSQEITSSQYALKPQDLNLSSF